MSQLAPFVQNVVEVVTNDGRVILGKLEGFDQTTNLILSSAKERIFSGEGSQDLPLGLYVVRGDSITVVGLVDEEQDAQIQWATVLAEPIAPVPRTYA
ncbi:hypothetical protein BATDEDRAFT_92607 [Batrachochytrium dendrobatidis JAM81]|uniref:LSM2-LSM8 complex subunit LSM8 n=2 Tax=Batrachochytrium dendrobatidis TaxID=109871 RepID=F4PE59_BATDJ|nr:uncharacterized protein BATDEDRAFT_92607 [Batrachochytrium dendrobatidis JAM81]EGF76595.1 hypothetical protein BATDEDRAFT_92607 [Batrachochytrium dendrobatidis JAM81]KAJ8331883.1 U6 snRNA-associated Sm-like protein [Batrachochytrium dendrobatidis]KAK5672620.1 U4/U6-U5 snRNP complex subunit LSM8 [Batrachochytrium dendrobatidis]OAJ39230.1 hypothetical protein BDEG_23092 [Batrachochytrium dendrobatidis JEL423]|eukprot:XP_006682924.1 hypothetical protein BATDEDRAFT_92607 [Batrachochytrium dendrobatidis JAM81]